MLLALMLALAAGFGPWATSDLAAQGSSAAVGQASIGGRVVDADSGSPLGGAIVTLRQAQPDRTAPWVRGVVRTDSLGSYRFVRLAPGAYEVVVERLGYLPNSVAVEVGSANGAQLSIALRVQPVVMMPVEVTGEATPPFVRGSTGTASVVGARRAVARTRQQVYLGSDVRAITRADVAEAVTLGEQDLFRAIQRVPGVTTRDDFTAVLWTRGAPWDQTRVYFDELPLFNPTHTGWLFSAVNADGLGSVVFQPGVRSAQWGEGAAGILDLRSRPGASRNGVEGSAELSLVSARLSAAGGLLDGRVGWMFAARRTYVDWFSRALPVFDSIQDSRAPYNFADLIGRIDIRGPGGWTLEASGLLEDDRVRGDLPGFLRGNRANWGNQVGRIALQAPLSDRLQMRVSRGATDFTTSITENGTTDPQGRPLATLPALSTEIRHTKTSMRVEPRAAANAAPLRWAAGVDLVADTSRYEGPQSLFQELYWRRTGGASAPLEYGGAGLNRYHAYWAEATARPGERLTLQAGVRVEVGDTVPDHGRTRVAPRIQVRFAPERATAYSVGWGRSFQYIQAISPVGAIPGPELHLGNIWILAGSGIPAMRSDIAVVGGERWIDDQWLVTLNGYHRYSTGVAIPEPSNDTSVFVRSNVYVPARNVAYGMEASMRRLVGRWTGSAGYAYGVSRFATERLDTDDLPDVIFPSPADVRHTVDLTGGVQMSDKLRAGAAFTYASGVPFTRMALSPEGSRIEEPNAERTPNYASVDGTAEYTTPLAGMDWTLSLQLRNVLNRRNAVTYSGSERDAGCGSADLAQCFVDRFERGLPRILLASVRVTF